MGERRDQIDLINCYFASELYYIIFSYWFYWIILVPTQHMNIKKWLLFTLLCNSPLVGHVFKVNQAAQSWFMAFTHRMKVIQTS